MKQILALLVLITTITFCAVPAIAWQQSGGASYYADKFEGRTTASGEIFRQDKMTAAHKTLKFGTLVEVEHQKTGKRVVVRINDRGPFIKGRIIDLSKRAAKELGSVAAGVAPVTIRKQER